MGVLVALPLLVVLLFFMQLLLLLPLLSVGVPLALLFMAALPMCGHALADTIHV